MIGQIVIRAERTGRDDTIRWICDGASFGALAPGRRVPSGADDSPLAQLVHDGRVVDVCVSGGHFILRAATGSAWLALAPDVHAALLSEAGAASAWLRAPAERREHDEPSLAEVQAVLDGSAGPVASSHGGRIEVVEVGPDSVVVTLHGACHGCSGSDATLTRLATVAVVEQWPHLLSVVEGSSSQDEIQRGDRWSSVKLLGRRRR